MAFSVLAGVAAATTTVAASAEGYLDDVANAPRRGETGFGASTCELVVS